MADGEERLQDRSVLDLEVPSTKLEAMMLQEEDLEAVSDLLLESCLY